MDNNSTCSKDSVLCDTRIESDVNMSNNLNKKSTTSEVNTTRLLLHRTVDDVMRETPITSDTKCGIWIFHGPKLQKFATMETFAIVYGFLSFVFSASLAYYTGIITTIEKRFQISTNAIALIGVSNNISQLLVSCVLSYYCGKGNRPRWMAVGIYIQVFSCFLALLPHLIYGPGADAIELLNEYNESLSNSATIKNQVIPKLLCHDKNIHKCEELSERIPSQVIFFIAKFLGGIGSSLLFTLGVAYVDDNIEKIKAPKFASLTFFIRLLGPGLGYCLSSFSLNFFISPGAKVSTEDPRFIGAWWLGWTILSILLFISASLMLLFPRTLPLTEARRILSLESKTNNVENDEKKTEIKTSFNDMMRTFKRLLTNKALMFNNAGTICIFFSLTPYTMYMPKYIELQYRQTASSASLITGIIGFIFGSCGLLAPGYIITKLPQKLKTRFNARHLTTWNIIVSVISVIGIIGYTFVGCPANDQQMKSMKENYFRNRQLDNNNTCVCEHVRYNPVCSENERTFASACHAGCRNFTINSEGVRQYTDCIHVQARSENEKKKNDKHGTADPGPCPVSCFIKLCMFMGIMSILSFMSTSGMATNFLVSIRSIDERDKSVALGLGLTIATLFAFIPSPLVFGWIIEKSCISSGQTSCTGASNCWLYDTENLRYIFNLTAASVAAIGLCCDIVTWHLVKHVKIFGNELIPMNKPSEQQ